MDWVRCGTRERRKNVRNRDYVPCLSPSCLLIEAMNTDLQESKSFKSAIKDDRWILVMKGEIIALYENGTWVLVDKPSDCNVIGRR